MKTYKTYIDRITLAKEPSTFKKVKITSGRDAADYARKFYPGDIEIFESMFLILLNRANNTIGYVKISQGGVSGTVVDVKIIAKYALESLASGVIMVHNHPSGNTEPSKADEVITDKVKNALALLDITLIDHLIVTESNFYSFVNEGKL